MCRIAQESHLFAPSGRLYGPISYSQVQMALPYVGRFDRAAADAKWPRGQRSPAVGLLLYSRILRDHLGHIRSRRAAVDRLFTAPGIRQSTLRFALPRWGR